MADNQMVRTRYAPSPTGFMHIGNLRTALFEYLIAKSKNGTFILRIEDTDQKRQVDGSIEVIYNTLKSVGLMHDEGPDIGGDYGPYLQSERKDNYLKYAIQLVKNGKAYYCFCSKDRLDSLKVDSADDASKYDRHCMHLSEEEVNKKLESGIPYVIRQIIPEGRTAFNDIVYGDISFDNAELDDQILIKSDGMPTYNFANVIDDHLMEITHVVRGCEYISSTPKYNLLYDAFGWDIPTYVHLPLVTNNDGSKLSKRKGDTSFEDLLELGYLQETIINYIALLGWSPSDNTEIFSLEELVNAFNISGLSKSPSVFDMVKLSWMNGEYIKKMDSDEFFKLSEETLKSCIKSKSVDLHKVSDMVKSRINLVSEIPELIDFIDDLPKYQTELYVHKKMKTDEANSLASLKLVLDTLKNLDSWTNEDIYNELVALAKKSDLKNSIILWPVRTALSGKPTTPCGASELAELLGKEESLMRIQKGIDLLSK